jgi:hypothetical protein
MLFKERNDNYYFLGAGGLRELSYRVVKGTER